MNLIRPNYLDSLVEGGFFPCGLAARLALMDTAFVAFLHDDVLDNGLAYIVSNGSRLDICSQQPANYTEATSTYTLGFKASMTPTALANHASSGRQTTIPAITDGEVTATDTATHWAFSKTTATTALLAAQSLTTSQAVTDNNTFTLDEIIIQIPDPTA